jgi:hypothetical protein
MQEVQQTGLVESPEKSVSNLNAPYPWIIHPVVDILFCCGVFPVIVSLVMLIGFRISMTNPVGLSLWALWIVGVHLFQDAHGVASWHRILTHQETMASVKKYVIVITVIAALAFFPLLLNEWLLCICVRVYLLIGVQHWLMQSYGVTLIYCMKRGYVLDKFERKLMLLFFRSIMCYAWVRFFTVKAYGESGTYGLQVPFVGPLPEWIMLTFNAVMFLMTAAFGAQVIRHYLVKKQLLPVPAIVLIATTLWVYLLPADTFLLLGYFIGAFYHGSQSWCITTSFHCKANGLPKGVSNDTIWKVFFRKSTWAYLFLLFVFSEVLFTIAPRVLTHFGISLGVTFATIVVVFSTHHFMCDSAIWKLKDPKIRTLLIQ